MPYIDRDAIPYFFTEDGSRLVAFKDFVDKVPDANVEPIKTAEWIVTEREDYWIPDITVKSTRPVFKCSACEKEFGLIASKYNYCPNCGAKIVGRRYFDE